MKFYRIDDLPPYVFATVDQLKRELGHLVVETTAKVTGKVLTADDQKRLQEEAARQLAS